MTVLVTTWRTLTLPGLPLASGSASRGEYVALHGAALRGVPEYGDGIECAELRAGVKGDWGMCSRRGVRDDRGAGIANDEGGIVMRGDCGLDRDVVLALLCETVLSTEDVDEEEADSNDVLRDKAG